MHKVILRSERNTDRLGALLSKIMSVKKCSIVSDFRTTAEDGRYTYSGYISRLKRKDHIDAIMKSDMIIMMDYAENPDDIIEALLLTDSIKKTVIVVQNAVRSIKWPLKIIDYDELLDKGHDLIPIASFYNDVVLDFLGGNREVVDGYNKYDGICHVCSDNMKQLTQFSTQLSNIKDVLPLDISFHNIIRFCKNQRLDGIDRLRLSALLIHRPLKETSAELNNRGLVEKTYWYLDDEEWSKLLDAIKIAGYPCVITHYTNGNQNSVPDVAMKRSHMLAFINDDNIFMTVTMKKPVVHA